MSEVVEPFNFVIGNVLGLDALEYHLGLSRGEITKFTDIMTTPLHRDMINLFKAKSWALLPTLDVIKTIWDLFNYNQSLSTTTLARRMFTQDLPEKPVKPYQYELLPVCTPDKLPIYIRDKRHDYIYSDLPRIETSIHPCFVIKSLCQYVAWGNLDYAPNSLIANPHWRRLVSETGLTSSLPINLSWLHGTWTDYPERPAVAARPDPVPIVASSNEVNIEDDGYTTDEPRNLYDPRGRFVLQAMDTYMAKHDKRLEVEEAEREAQHTPPVAEQAIHSDSSLESINSTDVQPPTTVPPRRSQRVKPTNVVQPALASKKRARAAVSSSASSSSARSIDESPSKRQRSIKKDAVKKQDDSTAPPPPAVRRSARTRKVVFR
ncbi:hypothetical protein CPB85DRAFT_1307740 [Mucidula mucida]|nr:hypothetical protein CPB85DRAFT_1307740 [Mucidula mucida]